MTYTVAGFDITSFTGFGIAGLASQRFALKGAFGPFSITGNMWFGVTPPAYLRSDLTSSFDFGGIAIGATVRHWTVGNFAWPMADLVGQTPAALGVGLQYILTTTVSPVTVRARFVDASIGTEFQDLLVTLRGLGLCCGITYNVDFSFTRAGFDEITLTGLSVSLGFGVSFDIGITYSVTAKSVTITPRLAGIGDACFTVWARPVVTDTPTWEGIRVDGFRIRCTIADCNYLEYVHAFVPAAPTAVPAAIRGKFLAALAENEDLELGFCGPGCCGGRYEVTLRTMWSTTAGGIFGITRFVGAVKIPLMTNFTLNLDFVMPAVTLTPMHVGAGHWLPRLCKGVATPVSFGCVSHGAGFGGEGGL